jgi:FlaA1/EpsC-like NDP-sugar epimerase
VSSDNAAQRSCPFDWTKAIGERAVVGLEAPDATVCAVRLPNVFRTAGSVIQRFEKQVRTGGAVTVIDAAASRRYLTLHEAAQWLLRVAEIAESGAIYAVDAGVDVEILELARRIIRLHGLEPERDVPIKLMSPRQGEKRSCSLWGPDEQLLETSLREVVRVVGTPWDLRVLQQELSCAEAMADPEPAYVRELLRRAAPRFDDAVPVATEQPADF